MLAVTSAPRIVVKTLFSFLSYFFYTNCVQINAINFFTKMGLGSPSSKFAISQQLWRPRLARFHVHKTQTRRCSISENKSVKLSSSVYCCWLYIDVFNHALCMLYLFSLSSGVRTVAAGTSLRIFGSLVRRSSRAAAPWRHRSAGSLLRRSPSRRLPIRLERSWRHGLLAHTENWRNVFWKAFGHGFRLKGSYFYSIWWLTSRTSYKDTPDGIWSHPPGNMCNIFVMHIFIDGCVAWYLIDISIVVIKTYVGVILGIIIIRNSSQECFII